MTTQTHTRSLAIASLLAAALLGSADPASAQNGGTPASLKIGIVPFTDATASGNRAVGADVAKTLQAELVHSSTLVPRVLEDAGSSIGADKAVELGRAQHLDLVFVGTVLEAKTEQSNKRGWLPSIKGQSASLDVHRMKGTVVLQGELYDVATGERLFSTRVTGADSSNGLGGTAYTTLGSFGNDSYQSFLESPLGKALRNAVADMAKRVAAARPSKP
ncbi:MAG: hypothetical protein JWL71_3103 [Acidobacteria bacterium]|jgi:hypothetical protein|nr:hypothetical protein [Acidobacteriota bacterium]